MSIVAVATPSGFFFCESLSCATSSLTSASLRRALLLVVVVAVVVAAVPLFFVGEARRPLMAALGGGET